MENWASTSWSPWLTISDGFTSKSSVTRSSDETTSNDADGYFFGDLYLETELIRLLGPEVFILLVSPWYLLSPMLLQRDVSPPDNLVTKKSRCLGKTVENAFSDLVMRVLKCYKITPKSPSGEIDVKFQLTKDTLEAMLTSLAYISEQLSNVCAMEKKPNLFVPFCLLQ
ncbi:hypothetical protein EZV62_028318 [Acer yangbiense]|uniref:Uncharacterized protein n=1 Tax=Acer yangbiense TaxID=1000413 RepID=A0A5C7GN35_9ROSI|nr:hypothetical protein EZV62_028318 [Acer yangbiense]